MSETMRPKYLHEAFSTNSFISRCRFCGRYDNGEWNLEECPGRLAVEADRMHVEIDGLRQSLWMELAENLRLFDMIGIDFDRGEGDGTTQVARRVKEIMGQRDALLAACEAWVDYFDKLTKYDEPGDRLGELRNAFHRERVEMTRAAIARATAPAATAGEETRT